MITGWGHCIRYHLYYDLYSFTVKTLQKEYFHPRFAEPDAWEGYNLPTSHSKKLTGLRLEPSLIQSPCFNCHYVTSQLLAEEQNRNNFH